MRVDLALKRTLVDGLGSDASACLNCGSCTALCPLGLGVFPRRLFRYALLGARERLLENTEAVYSCLLCKMCEENCPAGVHITENVRSLRSYLDREVFRLGPGRA
jgi:heterodisulfide reductase subunit C